MLENKIFFLYVLKNKKNSRYKISAVLHTLTHGEGTVDETVLKQQIAIYPHV